MFLQLFTLNSVTQMTNTRHTMNIYFDTTGDQDFGAP